MSGDPRGCTGFPSIEFPIGNRELGLVTSMMEEGVFGRRVE